MPRQRTFRELPVSAIQAGQSCRDGDDKAALDALAGDVQGRGVLEPIMVQPAGDGWTCFVGLRRLQAARAAGLETVPCFVYDEMTRADVLEHQLVENLHRRDLNDVEKARLFQELKGLWGCSMRDMARRLSVNHGVISRALALLNQPAAVQELVEAGELPPSTAAVLKYEPPAVQEAEARHLADTGATRAEAQRRLRPQPKVFALETPDGWPVTLTAPRSRATRAEMRAQVYALAEKLRAEEADGPRLAA
jgi:ParB/RepB/Spo0J family partition protein